MNEAIFQRLKTGLVALLAVIGSGAMASAQVEMMPRSQHAWGRFPVGSWSRVRKLTEDLDESGNVKSVRTTETKTVLQETDANGVTLLVDVQAEVAGKRFPAQPKTMRIGFNGETNGERLEIRKTGTAEFEVGARKVPCDVFETVLNSDAKKIVSRVLYSKSFVPHILKRDSSLLLPDGVDAGQFTRVDAIAVEMPFKVLADVKSTTFLRTIQKHADGSTDTLEVYCADIPGGVVSHTSKELDAGGKTVRRSTLELLDYGVASANNGPLMGRRTLFQHHRRRTTAASSPVR